MVIEDEMCSFGCSRSFLWYWSAQLLRACLALCSVASCGRPPQECLHGCLLYSCGCKGTPRSAQATLKSHTKCTFQPHRSAVNPANHMGRARQNHAARDHARLPGCHRPGFARQCFLSTFVRALTSDAFLRSVLLANREPAR